MGPLHHVIAAARRRLQWQRVLNVAALFGLLACLATVLIVYAARLEWIAPQTMGILLAIVGVALVAILVWAKMRQDSDAYVAQRLDRAHGFADRLGNAVAFAQTMQATQSQSASGQRLDAETQGFMQAAIADGVAAAVIANPVRAIPYTMPRHGRAALAFAGAALVLVSLGVPAVYRGPVLLSATPPHAAPGAELTLVGERLGEGTPGSQVVIGGQTADVIEWSSDKVLVKLASNTPLGTAAVELRAPHGRAGGLSVDVVDARDARFFREEAVVLSPEEKQYIAGLIARLQQIADEEEAPELKAFAETIASMVASAERGEVTKEQLLDTLRQAEEKLASGAEPSPDEVDQALAQTGAMLSKSPVTKSLGDALSKGDLKTAASEFDKLADKLDQDQLTEQQKDELAKALDAAAKAFAKRDEAQDKTLADKVEEAKQAVRRLEKEKEQAKTPREQADKERRLVKAKRDLERLQKEKEEKQASEQRDALKRLHKDMEKVAEDLAQRNDPKDPNDDKDKDGKDGKDKTGQNDKSGGQDGQNGENGDKQAGGDQDGAQGDESAQKSASRKMREAARETGRVDSDKRKQTAARKATSQMDDLREALRRAKQRGNKGPQNPFGKKESEFARRAAAKRGQGGAGGGQPGGGQGQPGQGGQGPGGQGQQPGGSDYGDGHDPDFAGAPTDVSGNTKDEDLQGLHGKGPSRRQTILSAAQKGFASAAYKPVYADYEKIIEDVMRAEKVPSAYRHYIKRYFDSIKPQ